VPSDEDDRNANSALKQKLLKLQAVFSRDSQIQNQAASSHRPSIAKDLLSISVCSRRISGGTKQTLGRHSDPLIVIDVEDRG